MAMTPSFANHLALLMRFNVFWMERGDDNNVIQPLPTPSADFKSLNVSLAILDPLRAFSIHKTKNKTLANQYIMRVVNSSEKQWYTASAQSVTYGIQSLPDMPGPILVSEPF
jgi:hypothetical protein